MKAYNDIMEWLATKPKIEELESVLSFINEKAKIAALIERIRSKRELGWYEKNKKDFEKHDIKTFTSSTFLIRKELLN